jgi:hypothetical protein
VGFRQAAALAGILLLAAIPEFASAQPLGGPAIRNGGSRPELFSDPSLVPDAYLGSNRPAMLPDSMPPGQSPAAIVLNVDYTLLRPRRQASDFAIADPNTTGLPEGTIESLQPGPGSGFRAGLAYQRPGSAWMLGFTYSYFRDSDALTVVAPAGGVLYATLTRPGLITTVDTATASTTWTSDLYDIEMGRDFSVDPNFTLRLSGGARIANIGQALTVLYNGRDAVMAQLNTGFGFVGAGMMTGAEAQWKLLRGFGVFGRMRGGMLYGSSSSYLHETNAGGAVLNSNISGRASQAVPFLEMALGLSWAYRRVSICAGYEFTNWFQLVATPDLPDDVATGKLIWRQSNFSLDGLFVRLGYSF